MVSDNIMSVQITIITVLTTDAITVVTALQTVSTLIRSCYHQFVLSLIIWIQISAQTYFNKCHFTEK